ARRADGADADRARQQRRGRQAAARQGRQSESGGIPARADRAHVGRGEQPGTDGAAAGGARRGRGRPDRHGPDDADPEGVTPLIWAIWNTRFDVAKYLIEHGANVNRWDWWGRTPLYLAVDY